MVLFFVECNKNPASILPPVNINLKLFIDSFVIKNVWLFKRVFSKLTAIT